MGAHRGVRVIYHRRGMSRPLALLVAFALLVPAPAAGLAQTGGGAFGPLPPAQPAETPEPEEAPADNAAVDQDISRSTLFLVAIGVLLAFVGLGWAITRDARRNLNEVDRAAVDGYRAGDPIRKQDRAKARERARQKTRAQRQARKKTRRAGRR